MDLRFFPQKIDSYRARNTNTIVKHTEVVIDRHVAGAWPRARFGTNSQKLCVTNLIAEPVGTIAL